MDGNSDRSFKTIAIDIVLSRVDFLETIARSIPRKMGLVSGMVRSVLKY
ncbi:MAG: hypothetical protein ACFBSE_04625 [Prochloraceae cyanobacterium]